MTDLARITQAMRTALHGVTVSNRELLVELDGPSLPLTGTWYLSDAVIHRLLSVILAALPTVDRELELVALLDDADDVLRDVLAHGQEHAREHAEPYSLIPPMLDRIDAAVCFGDEPEGRRPPRLSAEAVARLAASWRDSADRACDDPAANALDQCADELEAELKAARR